MLSVVMLNVAAPFLSDRFNSMSLNGLVDETAWHKNGKFGFVKMFSVQVQNSLVWAPRHLA
jgi:hypothetical protein